jgi:hypothetical protein
MARRRIGDAPLTAAERQRRRRERLAANRDTERSHEIPLAAEVERLNCELATLRAELAFGARALELDKMTRSRDYWKRRAVASDERLAREVRERENWRTDKESTLEQLKQFRKQRDYWRDRATAAEAAEILAGMLPTPMPLEIWRRLVQLAHPDKHGGSEAAEAATVWLNRHKPPATTTV